MNTTLRVWHIINPPNDPTYCRVNSIEEAVRKINELAQEDLNVSVEVNIFGLEEVDVNGEWEEWYDEGGFDIEQVMDGESYFYDENGKEISYE